MSMSDPIADMLTRIRNSGRVKLADVSMPTSKMKEAIAAVLKDQGYIRDAMVEAGDGPAKSLRIELKYKGKNQTHVIEGLQRISKPSCRVYVGSAEIPKVLGGLGVTILSTSAGIMSGAAAKKQNIGGEVLCYVW